jgi:hypothetical protein
MTFQRYALAAGYSSAGSLVNVETSFPTYQEHPLIVQGRGTWDDGIERERADKLSTLTGFQIFKWKLPVMSMAQYDYAQDTYTTGSNGLRGKVTVTTRSIADDDTWANYNAVMHLPKRTDLERKQDAFLDVEIIFVVHEAL